jgi:hypothetical protein
MNTPGSHWEYGGDFPWPQPSEITPLLQNAHAQPVFSQGVFFGTGRAAFLALLEQGKATRGWRRLLVPSYFCPRVMETIEQAGWDCPRYADNPLSAPYGLPTMPMPGDVVLRMNFFGWRGAEAISESANLGCDVIEDHSHDPFGPWSMGSKATYCIVSLRKTMPLPDGGWLWSPRGAALPNPGPPSDSHLIAAGLKIAGMTLKQHFRAGIPLSKHGFLNILLKGEALLGTGTPGGIHPLSKTLLEQLSPQSLAKRREQNFRALLESSPVVRRLSPILELPPHCTPFALVLAFESHAERERVKLGLIERGIYPSILWTLPGARDQRAIDFGNRSLTLPCHYQYKSRDIEKTAFTVDALAGN